MYKGPLIHSLLCSEFVELTFFYRDEKPPPPNVAAAKGYAAQLLAGACRLSFARASIGWGAVVAL